MTKGKSYNRIVFFTTLSVYLGLVLVSGTAPVLAHSALNRNFDIRNEIEFRDDLDNKPDNGEIENIAGEVPSLFAQLLDEIKSNIDSGKVSLPIPKDFNFEIARAEYKAGSGHGIGPRCGNGNFFYSIIENALTNKFQRTGWNLSDYVNTYRNSKSILQSSGGNWSLTVSFSKLNAAEFAEFLNNQFSSSAKTVSNNLLKQVYENTKVNSENNQVFIVTRLPRGSIDSLLAKNE